MTKNQKNIRKLVVAYNAYQEASAADDSNGISVWGKMLIEAQNATRVVMIEEYKITGRIQVRNAIAACDAALAI